MKDTDYAFAVAYTRTLENKMLTQADLETLLNFTEVSGAVRFLTDKGYADIQQGGTSGKTQADALLKAELEYAWEEVREACPKGAPINILLYQNDFQNLKTVVKAVFSNTTTWRDMVVRPHTVDPEAMHEAVSTGKLDDLPVFLRKSAEEAYGVLVHAADGQAAEIVIDKAAFKMIRAVAREEHSSFLLGWADLQEVLANMKIALRGAMGKRTKEFLSKALVDNNTFNTDILLIAAVQDRQAVLNAFGENGYEDAAIAARSSLSEFEKWCDNVLMEYVKQAQTMAFGFEPLLGFLYGKKTEIQAVRIVLYGILNKNEKNELRERLREMYV